ncbi:MAG TPA: hypothetical protein VJR29_07860 [bacterium]|nr:hypothetical protein [bacterium]
MQSTATASKIEEFVAYDERGRAVVLRSNRQPNQEEAATPVEKPAFTKNDPKSLFAKAAPSKGGSMSFFVGFSEVKARFQGQGR